MSGLVPIALRMAVRYMLMGQTSAGDRVLESPVDPISVILDQADTPPRPLIAVYTQEVSGPAPGREISASEQLIELVIWSYLPPDRVVVDSVDLNARGAGSAIATGVLSAQINRAFRFSPSPWREIYEEIVHNVVSVKSNSVLAELEGGVWIPGAEIVVACKAIPEPTFGRPLSGVWPRLDALMRKEPEVAGLADMFKALIEAPQGLADWRVVLGQGAYSGAEGRGLGIAPLDPTETGTPAKINSIDTNGGTDMTKPSTVPT